MCTDIARGLSLLSIPLAYAVGALTLPHLFAVALINGSLTVFFTLAYQAYLPTLLERKDLVEGNVKFEATETVARLAGPGAAGGLVAVLSAPLAVLADAFSFLASGSLIHSMRHVEETSTTVGSARRTFWSELREGGRFAVRDAYARSLLATTAVLNVGFNMAWAILLVFAVRELAIGPGLVGIVLSAGEVAGLLAALLTSRLLRTLGVGRLVIGSVALFGPALLVLALAPHRMPIPLLVLGWAIVSFASVVFNTTAVSVRQARVPQRLQGRVVGFNRTIVWGVSPFGAVAGGALATVVGLRFALISGAVVCVLALLPAVLSPLRALRDLPELAESGRGAAPSAELPAFTIADA